MTSQKGISLISLTIYLIAMLITITVITVITSYFYKNVDVSSDRYTYLSEFTKFESYILQEAETPENRILDLHNGAENEQTYAVFSSGNQYTFVPANNAIYQNNVKIASGVTRCVFTQEIENEKTVLKTKIAIQGNNDAEPKIRQIQITLK